MSYVAYDMADYWMKRREGGRNEGREGGRKEGRERGTGGRRQEIRDG